MQTTTEALALGASHAQLGTAREALAMEREGLRAQLAALDEKDAALAQEMGAAETEMAALLAGTPRSAEPHKPLRRLHRAAPKPPLRGEMSNAIISVLGEAPLDADGVVAALKAAGHRYGASSVRDRLRKLALKGKLAREKKEGRYRYRLTQAA